VLTVRLDRIGPGGRDVLRCASIVVGDVHSAYVYALVPTKHARASKPTSRHRNADG
jgi:hypothetical protein